MDGKINKIVLCVLSVLIIICIVVSKIDFKTVEIEGTSYTIRYEDYSKALIYDMEVSSLDSAKKIIVTEKEQVICFQAPCDPISRNKYTVDYTEEYKEYFNKKFSNKKNNIVYIDRESMTDEDYKIISKILKIEYETNNKEYSNYTNYRVERSGDYYKSTKGYSVYHHYGVEDDYADTEVTVYMGERNTGGYSIEVVSVKKKDNDVIITVKENNPSTDTVTMAITYPSIKVILPFDAKNIEVVDIYGNNYYENGYID